MPDTVSPIARIAKYTLVDVVRQRSFIVMFAVCAVFIFLVRGCYQGNYMVNGRMLDAETIIRLVSRATFHIIAVGAMLATALLSMRLFRRDRDDGMQSCILSKPITRYQYVAGKVLGVWTLSTAFMLVLHAVVFITTSISLKVVMPEYILASLLCSLNLLFVIVAVLLLSLLMPDIAAFLCVMGIGVVGLVADGIYAISSSSPMAREMSQQTGSSFDPAWWKTVYYAWPKLTGAQQFAASLISGEGFHGIGSLYPLLNVIIYILVLGTLLFRRFGREDVV